MKLDDAKKRYHGEWIAFRPYDIGENPNGEVVLHNKDRRKFDSKLVARRLREVYITFTGPLVPKGYTVIF